MVGEAEDRKKSEEAAEEKAQVNPAARRDRPGDRPAQKAEDERGEPEVPPVQEEPLDPLGPGGIGG